MRIGIDARLYNQTGVGRYLRNLIYELALLDNHNDYFIYLKRDDYLMFNSPNKRWHKRLLDIPWHSLEEQIKLPYYLLKDCLNVAHFPYFNVPIFYPGKYLLTIHDLIVDHFETGKASTLPAGLYKIKRSGYNIITSIGIKRASFITAISRTTKKEIIDHYCVSSNKITVTYDAIDTNFMKIASSKTAKKYYKFPYILYVGNAYPHKNLERLIEAFSIVRIRQPVKLVLAGDDSYFFPRLKDYVHKLGLKKEVVFFGKASDHQLVNLYTSARSLVFPSLMEGFGLPNIEALICGCLPVISDISVFREIWGDRLDYFNPLKPENIAFSIMKTLAYPQNVYREKVEQAKRRVADFNWRQTALKTLQLYELIYSAEQVRI